MGDLSKLKVAIGQAELHEGRHAAFEQARTQMMDKALDAGADLLVLPGSLADGKAAHLIGLNDSRIDVAGNVVILEACGETYRIAMGPSKAACDFAVSTGTEPWTIRGEQQTAALSQQVMQPGIPSITMKSVGMRNCGQKVLAYDGGTEVRSAEGQIIARLRDDFEEDFACLSLVAEGATAAPCADKTLVAIVRTMRRFDEQVLLNMPAWIVGLSGGLDSSVTAVLLALAFGPERVLAYNLSSAHNSDATKSNARLTANALGISLRGGSIASLVDATQDTLLRFGYAPDALDSLARQNVQARVRGHLLSTFAAVEGGVVVNNGNRVECALGYATLYGDTIGALAPIADLTKVQLIELAREMNDRLGFEAVPENLLPVETQAGFEWQTMPSAELEDGQRDPMKWFYHDWLISKLIDDYAGDACPLMERYLEDGMAKTEMAKWITFYGLDNPRVFISDLEWVLRSMQAAVYKRIQAAPAITIASPATVNRPLERQGAFEPSARYNALKARILQGC